MGLTGLLTGCAVGPDYHRPSADIPPAWQPTAPWQEGVPSDTLLKGKWWELFQDPQLNPLVEQALGSNQNLRVAAARLEQAHDQLTIARSALFPSIDLGASASRSKNSANRPLATYSFSNQSTVQNDFRVGPAVNWEIDLFGRVRRQVEGARASAQQAQADFENTRLALMAELATDYFSLREADAEIDVVRSSLELERGALAFVSSRHELGFATGLDLAQQQALLEAAAAQLELLQNQRAQFEHAIATMIGTSAPSFTLAPAASVPPLPTVPVGLPSDLLQRRPDVASAERAMAAANARIGVARAAYFPIIDLAPGLGAPSLGWESTALANLVTAPSRIWSIGLSASQKLFDAGATRANVRFADADYTAAVATYRQTVLTAMEEVENGITGLTSLERARIQADASVRSAQKAFDIASERYKGGVDTYLDVITAQQTLLTNRRQAAQIQGQQFATAVYLVKALGGGWSQPSPPVTRSD
ncbi:MAG: outer membrane protein multidrug efflux system [Gammaproteobacteria bacterium]|jgi:NodT family efflux transporter outer membrane factor (OMF) lipoprotein|nr:outer membrane protein multidrug efflux system [Gammaproteobacteria bacterium]